MRYFLVTRSLPKIDWIDRQHPKNWRWNWLEVGKSSICIFSFSTSGTHTLKLFDAKVSHFPLSSVSRESSASFLVWILWISHDNIQLRMFTSSRHKNVHRKTREKKSDKLYFSLLTFTRVSFSFYRFFFVSSNDIDNSNMEKAFVCVFFLSASFCSMFPVCRMFSGESKVQLETEKFVFFMFCLLSMSIREYSWILDSQLPRIFRIQTPRRMEIDDGEGGIAHENWGDETNRGRKMSWEKIYILHNLFFLLLFHGD